MRRISLSDAVYLIAIATTVAFLCGMLVAHYKTFPYNVLRDAYKAAADWRDHYQHYLGIKPDKHLSETALTGSGVTLYDPDHAQEGLTYLTLFKDDITKIILVAMDGTTLHEWTLPYTRFFPTADHVPTALGDWDTSIHGAVFYRNGDIVFNFDHGGTVKVDKCGVALWTLPYETHHSVFMADSGNLWISASRQHGTALDWFPSLDPPFTEDIILEVSNDGKMLREISMLDLIFSNYHQGIITRLVGSRPEGDHDFLHLNHVETLSSELARDFGDFVAGDVMVSFNTSSTILIFDADSLEIKWSMTGPFLYQHDPHFRPGGTISVYDNRRPIADGDRFGGSRILEIDPLSDDTRTLVGGPGHNIFYSRTRGKHQHLPNGDVLIVETEGGRVIEVAADQSVVWSYLNRYSHTEIAQVTQATRVPTDWPDFLGAQCK